MAILEQQLFFIHDFFRWVVGIWLVMKLSSDDLLDRLKKKGTRDPGFTKALIIDKLNDNDADVATTSLKVTVSCPLGKMRMRVSFISEMLMNHSSIDLLVFRYLVVLKPVVICNVSMLPPSCK